MARNHHSGDFDPVIWEKMHSTFADTVDNIRTLIDVYGQLMEMVRNMPGVPPKVIEHAKMALETYERERERWHGLADDFFVMENVLEKAGIMER
jgi:hypothetical protein